MKPVKPADSTIHRWWQAYSPCQSPHIGPGLKQLHRSSKHSKPLGWGLLRPLSGNKLLPCMSADPHLIPASRSDRRDWFQHCPLTCTQVLITHTAPLLIRNLKHLLNYTKWLFQDVGGWWLSQCDICFQLCILFKMHLSVPECYQNALRESQSEGINRLSLCV